MDTAVSLRRGPGSPAGAFVWGRAAALDRLLDPENESITLKTLQNAARAELNLVVNDKAA